MCDGNESRKLEIMIMEALCVFQTTSEVNRCSKSYSSALNMRIYEYVEKSEIFGEEQEGIAEQ